MSSRQLDGSTRPVPNSQRLKPPVGGSYSYSSGARGPPSTAAVDGRHRAADAAARPAARCSMLSTRLLTMLTSPLLSSRHASRFDRPASAGWCRASPAPRRFRSGRARAPCSRVPGAQVARVMVSLRRPLRHRAWRRLRRRTGARRRRRCARHMFGDGIGNRRGLLGQPAFERGEASGQGVRAFARRKRANSLEALRNPTPTGPHPRSCRARSPAARRCRPGAQHAAHAGFRP